MRGESPSPEFAARISTSPRKRGEVNRASRQTDQTKIIQV